MAPGQRGRVLGGVEAAGHTAVLQPDIREAKQRGHGEAVGRFVVARGLRDIMWISGPRKVSVSQSYDAVHGEWLLC